MDDGTLPEPTPPPAATTADSAAASGDLPHHRLQTPASQSRNISTPPYGLCSRSANKTTQTAPAIPTTPRSVGNPPAARQRPSQVGRSPGCIATQPIHCRAAPRRIGPPRLASASSSPSAGAPRVDSGGPGSPGHLPLRGRSLRGPGQCRLPHRLHLRRAERDALCHQRHRRGPPRRRQRDGIRAATLPGHAQLGQRRHPLAALAAQKLRLLITATSTRSHHTLCGQTATC